MDALLNFLNKITDRQKACAISCIGGGGKTSLLYWLANHFSESKQHVLISSLTKAARAEKAVTIYDSPNYLNDIEQSFQQTNPLYFIRDNGHINKCEGIAEYKLQRVFEILDVLLIENDGARNCPVKWHTDYDPMVPEWVNLCLVLVGADAVGEKVFGGLVHRANRFAKHWDVPADMVMDAEFIAEIVTSTKGYGCKIPKGMPVAYVVNKGDKFPDESRTLARAILNYSNRPVFYGSVRNKTWNQI